MANEDLSKEQRSDEEEDEDFKEALREVQDRLRTLEDREFHDKVMRMSEENDRLRQFAYENSSRNSVPLASGDRAGCPKCNGTGLVECHVCDGRGSYFGRRGLIDPCDNCYGKRTVGCTE